MDPRAIPVPALRRCGNKLVIESEKQKEAVDDTEVCKLERLNDR